MADDIPTTQRQRCVISNLAGERVDQLISGCIYHLRRLPVAGNVSQFYPDCRHLWDEFCCYYETGHNIEIGSDFHEVFRYVQRKFALFSIGERALFVEYFTCDDEPPENLEEAIRDGVEDGLRWKAREVDINRFEETL
ncbi:MAG: hypothetical protein HRU33_22320 [Rhodobacteraceae bacterium]|nr:hypothetical protein [Paracoccaceae bacterium]